MRRAPYRDAHICCMLQFRCARMRLPGVHEAGDSRCGTVSSVTPYGWHED